MLRTILVPAVACVVLATAAVPAQAQRRRIEHPRLHAALYELREARREIQNARVNFGGRRDKALVAVDDAIKSIRLALRVQGDDVSGLDRDTDRYKRFKTYPRIRRALEDLRDAREELIPAKGMHHRDKARALRDINYAIFQLSALLQYSRT